jgi:HlyD family secretion protein
VEVGAQVNGMIQSFGRDRANPSKPVDNGSIVRAGDVLAQIDPSVYQAQVEYARASLARAQADLRQTEEKCDQAKNEWDRAKSLLPEKAIADTDYDTLRSNYRVAKGSLDVARAAIQQCEAQLSIAETYLRYTTITAPIDGVIIDRKMSVGQTVMTALNAPALFVIAKELRRVQVWASVKETDIGRIQSKPRVSFTVDAYPGEVFEGKVAHILYNPKKDKDCSTYTVVVVPKNSHGMLPNLTARLNFQAGGGRGAGLAWDAVPLQGGSGAGALCVTDPGASPVRPAGKATSPVGRVNLPKVPGPVKKGPSKAAGHQV